MKNSGRIIACDIYSSRLDMIKSGAERLGINIIETKINDASVFNPDFPQADRVLCDVPCSGLGVIRRKPEIKYKNEAELERLPEIQLSILETSSKYLKDGGEIVYSTCSVSRSENDEVVDRFLERNPQFKEIPFLENIGGPFGMGRATVFPKDFGSDGFFICKLRRKP